MDKNTDSITVALAVHKSIIDYFHMRPLSDNQVISSSIRPTYDIVTIETLDYAEFIPTIIQLVPFVKVVMPIELDRQIRSDMQDYDLQYLPSYSKANLLFSNLS